MNNHHHYTLFKALHDLHLSSITSNLGSGQFGTVDKGVWTSPEGPIEVAVKKLNDGVKEKYRVKFLQEAAINGQFHHPNVIRLHGVVTVGEPVSDSCALHSTTASPSV